MLNCRACSAAPGIEAAPLHRRLFSTIVGSVLSYGAEVWGVQLAAVAAAGCGSTAGGREAPPQLPAASARPFLAPASQRSSLGPSSLQPAWLQKGCSSTCPPPPLWQALLRSGATHRQLQRC